jgi:hypothetical protein
MPKARGTDLSRRLGSALHGRLTEGRLLQLAWQLGKTLAALHNIGRIPGTTRTRTAHNDAHGGNFLVWWGPTGMPIVTIIDTVQMGEGDVEGDLRRLLNSFVIAIKNATRVSNVRLTATLYAAVHLLLEAYNEEWKGKKERVIEIDQMFPYCYDTTTSTIMRQGVLFQLDRDEDLAKPLTRREAYEAICERRFQGMRIPIRDITIDRYKLHGVERYPILDLTHPLCSIADWKGLGRRSRNMPSVVASVAGEVLRLWLTRSPPPTTNEWLAVIDATEWVVAGIGDTSGESVQKEIDGEQTIHGFIERLNGINGGDPTITFEEIDQDELLADEAPPE